MMLNIPLIPCSTMSFGCPQFERVSKERQVAQVEYEREKELIDWVGKREATRRFYLSTGSPARLRILFNEAKRLDYEYIQDVFAEENEVLSHAVLLEIFEKRRKLCIYGVYKLKINVHLIDPQGLVKPVVEQEALVVIRGL